MSITHQFVSGLPDGADATQVQPSNWNAAHNITTPAGISGGDGVLTGTDAAGNLTLSGIKPTSKLQFLRRNAQNNAFEFKTEFVLRAEDYNFTAQTPGGTLTSGITNTVTLTPVPAGVNGNNSGHRVYISNGTGSAEAVLITGGTAVSGAASGTITFTPVNNHSGAWTVSSATGGIQEAICDLAAAGGQVTVNSNTALLANVTDGGKSHPTLVVKDGITISGGFTIFGAVTYQAIETQYGSKNYVPVIDQSKGHNGVTIYPVVTSAGNTSILSTFAIQQSDQTKLSSNTYINGMIIDIRSSNATPNQNAGLMSFSTSFGGADPFGADCHAIIPAGATAAPAWCIGVQASTQVDKVVATNIFPLIVDHSTSVGQKATSYIVFSGSGANLLMSNFASAFTSEGIVLTPNDDLNAYYRVFGFTNAANTSNVFTVQKNGDITAIGYDMRKVGANVASANAITPTGRIFHVTGTAAIATINIPNANFTLSGLGGEITIIPDGAFTMITGSNIAVAVTAVVNKALRMVFDNNTSKWYPSY